MFRMLLVCYSYVTRMYSCGVLVMISNEHHRTLDNFNTKSKPTTVTEHFLSSPHIISNDMQFIPIEKTFLNRASILICFYADI